MYLAVNLPHHIATFGGVLLLTASHKLRLVDLPFALLPLFTTFVHLV